MYKVFLYALSWALILTSHAIAASYWLAPSQLNGSDSNAGTSLASPWLTPNHSLSCGDTIFAVASSSYAASSFSYTWGKVSCPAGNNVVWLKCVEFDACKISSDGRNAMALTASYWGVQGWELTTKATGAQIAACIAVTPPDSTISIHHIVIANMVCNGAASGGINTYNHGTAGIDYIAIIGNAIYDSARSGVSCYSGISLSGMVSVDQKPGAHTYVGGNISWDNIEPHNCYGGSPTDGEGIILDTWSGFETGLAGPYTSVALIDDNLLVRNGGRGITVYRNSSAVVYVRHNTIVANNQQSAQADNPYCSEFYINVSKYTHALRNLVAATRIRGCGEHLVHAIGVVQGDVTDSVDSTFGYSASGSHTIVDSSGAFGVGPSNRVGVDPGFMYTYDPGPPTCGLTPNVPSCMSRVIARFTPANPEAEDYGYATPEATDISDHLFPRWLCVVRLPAGLIPMGCSSSSVNSFPAKD